MTNGGVWLARGGYWRSIPPDIQRRIEEGESRIRGLRDEIANAARVRLMPRITIDPAVWVPPPGGVIHAASGVWRSKVGHEIAVIVAAGIAISSDSSLVRGILLHEFAHCFMLATKIIDHLDLGTPLGLSGASLDAARENRLLAEPADWFGSADSELLHWEDSRLNGLSGELVALAETAQLPATGPPLVERGTVIVPPEWAAHIRSLRQGMR
jgi:hypothetical protein